MEAECRLFEWILFRTRVVSSIAFSHWKHSLNLTDPISYFLVRNSSVKVYLKVSSLSVNCRLNIVVYNEQNLLKIKWNPIFERR